MAGRRTPKKTSRSDGAPVRADKADDSFARETFTAQRAGSRAGEGVSDPMADGGLHERGRILARTSNALTGCRPYVTGFRVMVHRIDVAPPDPAHNVLGLGEIESIVLHGVQRPAHHRQLIVDEVTEILAGDHGHEQCPADLIRGRSAALIVRSTPCSGTEALAGFRNVTTTADTAADETTIRAIRVPAERRDANLIDLGDDGACGLFARLHHDGSCRSMILNPGAANRNTGVMTATEQEFINSPKSELDGLAS